MPKLVSVIVPVYNADKYVKGCIESILNQTYKDIELILVNDGSTDQSGSVCREYENAERVQFFDRTNHGVSETRNFALSKANGDYVLYIDSDDTMEPEMIEILVRALEENNSDCSMCGMIHDYQDKKSRNFPEDRIQKTVSGVEAIKEIFINYIATAGPVCKLFKRELIDENAFPKDLSVGEDSVAVIQTLCKAKKVSFDTAPMYHYNHREESIMTSSFSKRDFDLIEAYNRIETIIKAEGYFADLQKSCKFRQIWARFHALDKFLKSKQDSYENKKRIKSVVSWLRRSFLTILCNPYVGTKRKLAMCGLFFNVNLYRRLIDFHK